MKLPNTYNIEGTPMDDCMETEPTWLDKYREEKGLRVFPDTSRAPTLR